MKKIFFFIAALAVALTANAMTVDPETEETTPLTPGNFTLDMGECAAQRGYEGIVIADAGYTNSVEIYNLVDGEYIFGNDLPVRAVLSHDDSYVVVTGVCSWNEVDGKYVFIANDLKDETGTITYSITATCPLPKEATLDLTGTYIITEDEWEKKEIYIAETEDGEKLTISTTISEWDNYTGGNLGEIYFSSVENLVVVDGENDTKTVTCVAYDYSGNTYNITIVATPYVAPEIVLIDVEFEEKENEFLGLILSGTTTYNGEEIQVNIYGYDPEQTEYTDVSIFEVNWMWDWTSTGIVTVTKVDGVYTVTGTFMSFATNESYNVTLTGAAVTSALENVENTVAPTKMIQNGQLLIIKNGVKYNVSGAIIK